MSCKCCLSFPSLLCRWSTCVCLHQDCESWLFHGGPIPYVPNHHFSRQHKATLSPRNPKTHPQCCSSHLCQCAAADGEWKQPTDVRHCQDPRRKREQATREWSSEVCECVRGPPSHTQASSAIVNQAKGISIWIVREDFWDTFGKHRVETNMLTTICHQSRAWPWSNQFVSLICLLHVPPSLNRNDQQTSFRFPSTGQRPSKRRINRRWLFVSIKGGFRCSAMFYN